ncbi:solute-binding protein [Cenarchaeum symbiosum A]|uniref:Solute-binding protein n=1 Tax=Cenarchaeum symbiosum (strain A) TaxID=414004 RepID=A0RX69_CENSY|nr:solute-binding protein [Cenarchaeum symbiosum A]
MRILPAVAAVLLLAGAAWAHGEKGTYVDDIRFIQYLDESTALEEVRHGNLDLYYSRISPDRIEAAGSREGLQVFSSTGGSYSILVNPAESKEINPFSSREARFALNYLVDRGLIVDELMGGYGVPMVSNYGPFDPDYLHILDQLESFRFEYNPALADGMISGALEDAGASKVGGMWQSEGEPVEVRVFIRSDDPVRKSIGEILASELEDMGLAVQRDYGDLNKALVVVYGSDPAELKWSLYTEGWGGRSAFVRYDPLGLGQMYSPWFSSMPGFNNPAYWNYENVRLDELTQRIFTGNFTSAEERADLIREATAEGVSESVRVFLAAKVDQYVVNSGVEGIVNDFGAGVPSRFTPINARTGSETLEIGVKQIYQGAWNPVMGLSDSYSTQIWNTLFDPGIFKHPYTGESFAVRTDWEVETAGPGERLAVHPGTITWDPSSQEWIELPPGSTAVSRATFEMAFADWHNGQPMDMNDILYSAYFVLEWGSSPGEDDRTHDSEYTPRAASSAETLVGLRPIDGDTIEVYIDYWHFDESEIADRASVWSPMPWEVYAAMEEAVLDGRASFSRSGAVSGGISWLSLIVPQDAEMIRGYLEDMRSSGTIPAPLQGRAGEEYTASRYSSSISWVDEKGHAVISNGPFYLEGYSPESRTIRAAAFDDESYPFEEGRWGGFEEVRLPRITGAKVPDIVVMGDTLEVPVSTEDASSLYYFLSGPGGDHASGVLDVGGGSAVIRLDGPATSRLGEGASDLRMFAVSDEVLRPDIYETSFLALAAGPAELPPVRAGQAAVPAETGWLWAAAAAAAAAGAMVLLRSPVRRAFSRL